MIATGLDTMLLINAGSSRRVNPITAWNAGRSGNTNVTLSGIEGYTERRSHEDVMIEIGKVQIVVKRILKKVTKDDHRNRI